MYRHIVYLHILAILYQGSVGLKHDLKVEEMSHLTHFKNKK